LPRPGLAGRRGLGPPGGT